MGHRLTPVSQVFRHSLKLIVLLGILPTSSVLSFQLDNRWTDNVTAMPGDGTTQGSPALVTWSLVPDGTEIPGKPWLRPAESDDPSDLVSFLDGLYETGAGGDSPLSDRSWFYLFQSSAERWSQLSGLTLVYEPADDGAKLYSTLFNSTTIDGPRGSLGVRGDIRIGGHPIDGEIGVNTLAYASFPSGGEMVIDTSNVDFFSAIDGNTRAVRNVIMHEFGHAIGIRHRESSSSNFLMEPNIGVGFDGPQFDDILAAHRWYGDVYEKSNNLAGNDTPENATWLGNFTQKGRLSIGTDASDMFVDVNAVDFVSIDDDSDTDFYRFSLPHSGTVSVQLIPRGPTYLEGPEGQSQSLFVSSAQSDLSLAAYGPDAVTSLGFANSVGLGGTEVLVDLALAGPADYFLQVTGAHNAAQMYELQVDYSPAPFLPGDINLDGYRQFGGDPATDDLLAFVKGWQTVLSTDDDLTAWSKGDLNLDRVSDLRDVFLMRRAVGDQSFQHLLDLLAAGENAKVPEPTSGFSLLVTLGMTLLVRKRFSHKYLVRH